MNEELIKLIKEEFTKSISDKNGWGKLEVLRLLDAAISVAAVKLLDKRLL